MSGPTDKQAWLDLRAALCDITRSQQFGERSLNPPDDRWEPERKGYDFTEDDVNDALMGDE